MTQVCTWNIMLIINRIVKRMLKHSPTAVVAACFMAIFWFGYKLHDQRVIKGECVFNKSWMHEENNGPNSLRNKLEKETMPTEMDQNAVVKRFERRKTDIKNACKRYNETAAYLHSSSRSIIHLKDQNISYCPIQKVASTYWQKIVYAISHPNDTIDSFNVRPQLAYNNANSLRMKRYDNVSDVLESSVSFVFVRDPFTRMLSGYLSKYFSIKTEFWKTGEEIVNEERSNLTMTSFNCGHDVSFREFVSYHTKRILSGQKIDAHFSPMINHCDVCGLNFKYIGKYETIEEDAKYIYDKFPFRDKFVNKTDFEKRLDVSRIKQDINPMFLERTKWTRCLSFQCGLYRIWQRFICRGFMSKNLPFPYSNRDQAENVTEEEFLATVIEAHEKSDPKETSNNRKEVLLEAYQSLGKNTFNKFVKAFENDFDVFGYSRELDMVNFNDNKIPSSAKRGVGFSYLKDCPF